jgi:8-oxo-dGTP pyrophosphatase MutT (NUDIX family)
MSMNATGTGLRRPAGWSAAPQPTAKFVPLAQLRKLRECEQVAAVCYRAQNGSIEFLLVRSGGGRWIFPKGGAEPGLTHAQAAALEAYEEAGVHGRMEEACFVRYIRRERDPRNSSGKSSEKLVTVNAHLCEVLRLEPPQEGDRNPTWFSAEKAKRRLREDRSPDYGAELARVIERAVTRIEQSKREQARSANSASSGTLQKVQFIDAARLSDGRGKASAG